MDPPWYPASGFRYLVALNSIRPEDGDVMQGVVRNLPRFILSPVLRQLVEPRRNIASLLVNARGMID